MESNELFKFLKSFNNESVFRNINKPMAENAFADLIDPEDDPEDAQLAVKVASDMRSGKSASHFDLAIQNVFLRSVFYPTRYGDGSFPVWYGSMDALTTIYETAYHMIREAMELTGQQNLTQKPVIRHKIIFKVTCTALLIDLTREKRHYSQLTDPINYTFTQQIGKRVRSEMHPGILTPSARKKNGINLAVFFPKILSNPTVSERLEYRLDFQTKSLKVIDEDGRNNPQIVASIDGNNWF